MVMVRDIDGLLLVGLADFAQFSQSLAGMGRPLIKQRRPSDPGAALSLDKLAAAEYLKAQRNDSYRL
jgi:hypothetical protein